MGARGLTRRALVGGAVAASVLPDVARAAGVRSGELMLTPADGRSVRVRATWPEGARGRLPLLVLSHGANGTLPGLALLQDGLTRGRIVAAPQHVDSEDNPDAAKADRAALPGQRVADMVAVLDAVPAIERLGCARIDPGRIAAAGHSFGALIAQALGGAWMQGRSWRDARVRRVVAISPPGPFPGLCDATGWARMAAPQLVTTGTADVTPPFAPSWDVHAASFHAARVPGSALWVGKEVDHYFGRNIQRLAREAPDQSAAFAALLRLADAFLRGEAFTPDAAVTKRFEALKS